MQEYAKQDGDTPRILILTHGQFGAELIRSAEMIIGDIENIGFIPMTIEQSVEEYRKDVFNKLDAMGEDDIVLVDLFGGTPGNTVALYSRNKKMNVIAGVNLNVLISCTVLRSEHRKGQDLLDAVLEEAGDSIQKIKV